MGRIVYVASSVRNKDRVRAAFELLIGAGHHIPLDWTKVPDFGSLDDPRIPDEAIKDFVAIYGSEVMWLLDHPALNTAKAELGLALGRGLRVMMIHEDGYHNKACIFTQHPMVEHFDSMEEALEALNAG